MFPILMEVLTYTYADKCHKSILVCCFGRYATACTRNRQVNHVASNTNVNGSSTYGFTLQWSIRKQETYTFRISQCQTQSTRMAGLLRRRRAVLQSGSGSDVTFKTAARFLRGSMICVVCFQ